MKIEPSTSLRDSTFGSVGGERQAHGPDDRAALTTPTSTPNRRLDHGPEPWNASPRVEFPESRRLVTVAWAGVSTTRTGLVAARWAGACLVALACSLDSKGSDSLAEPPGLSRPVASPWRAAFEYSLVPSSRAEFVVGGARQGPTVRGEVPVASGRVWLDGSDLATTRATLTFDLSAMQLWDGSSKKPPEGAQRSHLTEQSLDWLQLSRPADIQAHPELRYARFTLLGIGSSSSSDLDAAPTVRSGQPAVVARRVRLRASGELELHGHRLPQTVALTATFEWAATSQPGTPPARLLLETAEPIAIDLLAYRVTPRNARGEVLADGLTQLRRPSRSSVQVRARWEAELVRAPPAHGADLDAPAH